MLGSFYFRYFIFSQSKFKNINKKNKTKKIIQSILNSEFKDKRANRVDIDEMAHYEPPSQDVHCLQIYLFTSIALKELRIILEFNRFYAQSQLWLCWAKRSYWTLLLQMIQILGNRIGLVYCSLKILFIPRTWIKFSLGCFWSDREGLKHADWGKEYW